jgi:CRISPR system Cascade subunit CasE
VTKAFPQGLVESAGGGPRVLWRVDRNTRAETLLYLVSPLRPDLTNLLKQVGQPTPEPSGWQTYEYGSFLDSLTEGDTWAFRLTANPVHSIRRKDDEPIKRTAHRTPRHQMRWLLDRQEKAGFAVLERPADQRLLPEGDEHLLIVRDRRDLRFSKADGDRKHTVSLTAVTFEGRLRVTDAKLLRETLTSGLGKGKAYGCGLMTLAPVR